MDAVFKLGVFALQKLLNWKHGSFKLGEWGVFLLVKAVVSNIRVIFSHYENVCKGEMGGFLGSVHKKAGKVVEWGNGFCY